MDMEAEKAQLKLLFFTNINQLLKIVAKYKMERMPNKTDIEKIGLETSS